MSGNCCQLLRGECYEIEGKRVFALGGGESTDMDIRVEGETWWSRELPSAEELAHARETLASLNQQVDYIITHSVAPTVNKIRAFPEPVKQPKLFWGAVPQKSEIPADQQNIPFFQLFCGPSF